MPTQNHIVPKHKNTPLHCNTTATPLQHHTTALQRTLRNTTRHLNMHGQHNTTDDTHNCTKHVKQLTYHGTRQRMFFGQTTLHKQRAQGQIGFRRVIHRSTNNKDKQHTRKNRKQISVSFFPCSFVTTIPPLLLPSAPVFVPVLTPGCCHPRTTRGRRRANVSTSNVPTTRTAKLLFFSFSLKCLEPRPYLRPAWWGALAAPPPWFRTLVPRVAENTCTPPRGIG